MTPEHKEKMAAARKQKALAVKLKEEKGTAAWAIRCRKHAMVIDAIVLNGGSFLLKDEALKTASKLLKEAGKVL